MLIATHPLEHLYLGAGFSGGRRDLPYISFLAYLRCIFLAR